MVSALTNDYELVIKASKDLESILQDVWGCRGRGLGCKVKEAQSKSLSSLPHGLVQDVQYIAKTRNDLVHRASMGALSGPERESFVRVYERCAHALNELACEEICRRTATAHAHPPPPGTETGTVPHPPPYQHPHPHQPTPKHKHKHKHKHKPTLKHKHKHKHNKHTPKKHKHKVTQKHKDQVTRRRILPDPEYQNFLDAIQRQPHAHEQEHAHESYHVSQDLNTVLTNGFRYKSISECYQDMEPRELNEVDKIPQTDEISTEIIEILDDELSCDMIDSSLDDEPSCDMIDSSLDDELSRDIIDSSLDISQDSEVEIIKVVPGIT